METIKILIADDHAIVREGFHWLADSKKELELVGEAENGKDAVELCKQLNPDVILMDLVMPVMDGIDAIQEIMKFNPDAKILVLTSFSDVSKVFPAIKSGALGYLLKDSTPAELLQAIIDVNEGKPSLHPDIAVMLINEISQPTKLPLTENPLSEKEEEVLKLIAKGLTNQDIALKLTLSDSTVKTHVSNILTKLHLANRTQAALYALKTGIARLDKS